MKPYALANSKSLIWDGFVLNYCQPTADCREILGFSFYTLEAIL